jgi:ubiquinone/menaquinone biosynthesis C-methylase UbiE
VKLISSSDHASLSFIIRCCDSAKLPLASNSVDAIHAGAAMYCWPNINQSISEIFRVLKPGGVYYSSTFFTAC